MCILGDHCEWCTYNNIKQVHRHVREDRLSHIYGHFWWWPPPKLRHCSETVGIGDLRLMMSIMYVLVLTSTNIRCLYVRFPPSTCVRRPAVCRRGTCTLHASPVFPLSPAPSKAPIKIKWGKSNRTNNEAQDFHVNANRGTNQTTRSALFSLISWVTACVIAGIHLGDKTERDLFIKLVLL